jgi:hypothetical protein
MEKYSKRLALDERFMAKQNLYVGWVSIGLGVLFMVLAFV